MNKTYIAIDLKSFYASVECIERGLDPIEVNLVVADPSRTSKTICLAVSPALKTFGIPGRPRLFEVEQKIRYLNRSRGHYGKSFKRTELISNYGLQIDYIVAPPQMARYVEISSRIYEVYLKWIAEEDIHVYSIDEVFIDASKYLDLYHMTGEELASEIMHDVLQTTGISSAAGVGSNLYLCKVAMDILAKHAPPNKYGGRVAVLDEMTYREKLWSHKPITDFWRVGKGYAKRLAPYNLYTMGDIARFSLTNEDTLYKEFGVNAELLIDHAWGYEPCTIEDIKNYQPENTSLSSGQVLHSPYSADKAKLILKEMVDSITLDLVEKGMVTNQLVLTISYDQESLSLKGVNYKGPVTVDMYGRKVPKHAHGTKNLNQYTSSTKLLTDAAVELFDEIVDQRLLVRKITVTLADLKVEGTVKNFEQLDLFSLLDEVKEEKSEVNREKERTMQELMLSVRETYGKNSIVRAMNLLDGATGIERNNQIGGHKA